MLNFGQKIKKLRTDAGLSQAMLAEHIGVSVQSISNWECNMVTCYCIFPSRYYNVINGNDFEPLRDHPKFTKLCERVKVLIVTKQKES